MGSAKSKAGVASAAWTSCSCSVCRSEPFQAHPYLGFSFAGHSASPVRSCIRTHISKISIRFFDDREVRAIWDEQNAKWWFSVLNIVAVLTDQDDYEKTRNHWKYLKAKLKRENSEVVSATTLLESLAAVGSW